MIRSLVATTGLVGLALLVFDAINFPWWSPFFSAYTFERTWVLICNSIVFWILPLLILQRLWVISFFIQLFFEAIRWRIYQGPAYDHPIWTDDFNPDAI